MAEKAKAPIRTVKYDLPRSLSGFEVRGPFGDLSSAVAASDYVDYVLVTRVADEQDPFDRQLVIAEKSNIRLVKDPNFYEHISIHPEWTSSDYYSRTDETQPPRWLSHTQSLRLLPYEIEAYYAIVHTARQMDKETKSQYVTAKQPAITRPAHEKLFRSYTIV